MKNIKFKVCGVISVDEAEKLLTASVDYVGLNFIKDSTRCISIEIAEAITGVLKKSGIKTVALFRDQSLALVNDYSIKLGVDFVQLHGNETIEYAQNVNTPLIKAIPIKVSFKPDEIIEYIANYPAKYFVLDREQQGQGSIVNTDIASRIIAEFPGRIFLAGGLNSDNLEDILEQTRPHGIDIAGGVRTNNVLDIAKVNEILQTISAA